MNTDLPLYHNTTYKFFGPVLFDPLLPVLNFVRTCFEVVQVKMLFLFDIYVIFLNLRRFCKCIHTLNEVCININILL